MNILYTFNNQQTTKQFSDLLKEATYTILYFYPKDDTPGCTIEAKDFADHSDKFRLLNAQIVGVSKDNHKSHCKFQEKYGLSFGLISDPDFALHEQFGTVGEKSMYGKKYRGTLRSTFILDQKGTILKERRNISVSGHVEEVLDNLKHISTQ